MASSSFSEILQFIEPSTPEHVLNCALQLLLQLEENYLKNLSNKEKLLLFEKISLFFSPSQPSISSPNLILLLSILVNLTAIESSLFSNFLINSKEIIQNCMDLILEEGRHSTLAAQLFCNVSRQFTHQFVKKLDFYDSEFGSKLIDHFLTQNNVKKDDSDFSTYLGFLVVNLSTVKSIGLLIATNKIESLSSLLSSLDGGSSIRSAALQVVYNLSLQDEFHALMLSKDLEANKLLVSLLSPLVDCEDKLSEEEIESLPSDLQYWEKKRHWDLKLWEMTLCTVYQFCATRLGRSFLRNKNIYPLLREMDNARVLKQGEHNFKNGIIIEENGKNLDVLRAVISILIRREDEMGIEENEQDKLESIRKLGI
ncbi:hypothetical protein ACQ4LE_002570 [Meloidogyne hapla]